MSIEGKRQLQPFPKDIETVEGLCQSWNEWTKSKYSFQKIKNMTHIQREEKHVLDFFFPKILSSNKETSKLPKLIQRPFKEQSTLIQ